MKLGFGKRIGLFLRMLWKKISLIEKIIIIFLLLILAATLLGAFSFLFNNDENSIPAKGGVLVEGVLGQPKLINPLYARSDTDKVLSSLVFSGLVGYNKQREITPCLAERWEVSADKKDYKFFLKKNIQWQDGMPFNAEDVIYTIAVLQNPDYNESLKSAWDGVVIEKVDDFTVIFHLPKAYPPFLENLTIGILPRHLWVDIAVKDFSLSTLNLNAVGTGPYKIDKLNKDKDGKTVSLKMAASEAYSQGAPYIENLEVKFYDQKEDLLKAFDTRDFSSFGMYASEGQEVSQETSGFNNYNVNLPQYVGLFFNTKRAIVLQDKAVREALAYATDKNEINQAANYGAGIVINSPILPGYLGYDSEVQKYDLDLKTANSMLSQAGWSDQNNDGVKEKEDKKLIFQLIAPNDVQFDRVINRLQEEWGKIGVRLDVKRADSAQLENDYISPRNYDILLLGENIGTDPDPYSYWHSSQANSPGLNLALFQNGEADQLLEEARQSSDTNIRIKDYKRFQEIIAEEIPAIFLYQPVYVYKIYDSVKGIDLSGITNTWDRFYDVSDWYVKTRSK